MSKDNISEINKEIMYLCEVMGIDQKQIRYVMLSGIEFIGETLAVDYDDLNQDEKEYFDESSKNETIFFHPMKINVEIDIDEDGHMFSNKYFSVLNPYSGQPFSPFKNYNILTQSPIYPDLMLEYLRVVYKSYFADDDEEIEPKLITTTLKKNNIVNFHDYKRKR